MNTGEQHVNRGEVGHENQFGHKFEQSNDSGFADLPDSPTNSRYPPSANESDEDDVNHEAIVCRANQFQDRDENDQHH